MATEASPDLRRILVALDSGRESLAALEAAVRVAARLHAELVGLFVEDIDLLSLSGLPFARAFGTGAAGARKLDPQTIERELRGQAAAAQRALERAAAALEVPWSFRVARGAVQAELIAAALEADLVALGKAIRPLTRRPRLGSTTSAVAAGVPTALLLAGSEPAGEPERVMAVYDGSPCARRALDIAASLAQRDGGAIRVFLLGDRARLETEVKERLAGQKLSVYFRAAAPDRLAGQLRDEHGGFLVLGEECLGGGAAALAELAETAGCPILLVRAEKPTRQE